MLQQMSNTGFTTWASVACNHCCGSIISAGSRTAPFRPEGSQPPGLQQGSGRARGTALANMRTFPASITTSRRGRLRSCLAVLAVLGLALGFALFDPAFADQQAAKSAVCKAPRELTRLTMPLEAVRAAMGRDGDFRVVALGSSSTQGAGASSPKMCYPAQLEAELNRRFHPDKHFEVINLGVGGELASDMLARIDGQVLPLKPDLVVWQTGVNDALSGVSLDDFRMELAQGIDAIRSTGADVILLDLQYYPRSERVQGYKDYLRTMWSVAHEKSVPVLKRHAFMKHLLDSRQFTPAQILAPDLFHLNDLSYRCLGHLVADAIGDGLEQASRAPQRNRTAAAR